jgi:hypothetical protein
MTGTQQAIAAFKTDSRAWRPDFRFKRCMELV